jgi:hypothetical protein
MNLEEEFEKALEIINNLIDNLAFLPYTFGDKKAFGIDEEIIDFMKKHNPERWTNR